MSAPRSSYQWWCYSGFIIGLLAALVLSSRIEAFICNDGDWNSGKKLFFGIHGSEIFFEEELLSISRYCEGRLRSYLIGYIAGNNNVKDQCPHFVWLSSPNF